MSTRWRDKVALVAGAGRGIGEATGRDVADHAGAEHARFVPCDMTDPAAAAAAVAATLATFGRLDIPVNNAMLLTSVPTFDQMVARGLLLRGLRLIAAALLAGQQHRRYG